MTEIGGEMGKLDFIISHTMREISGEMGKAYLLLPVITHCSLLLFAVILVLWLSVAIHDYMGLSMAV